MTSGAVAGPLGDGVAAYDRGDYATALRLWRPLAEQGDANAQFDLGGLYEKGEGVPKDYVEAAKWLRLAAEQGNFVYEFNLGLTYYDGKGVPQDCVLAHMWFNLAATQGYDLAIQMRDSVAAKMTADQIAEAQRMAREWKPTTQP